MNKETNESVVLTPELFKEIANDMSDEIISLKHEQSTRFSQISDEKEYLNQLKAQYKETRKAIRLTRRGLKKEKRSLKKVTNTLNTQSNLFVEINAKFVSKEETYIDVKRYIKTRNEG